MYTAEDYEQFVKDLEQLAKDEKVACKKCNKGIYVKTSNQD